MERIDAYAGLDVQKEMIAVAIADANHGREVRFCGTIPNTAHQLQRIAEKFTERHDRFEFTYEAGPCGYDNYRQLKARGLSCHVIAPSLIPRRRGPEDMPSGSQIGRFLMWYNRLPFRTTSMQCSKRSRGAINLNSR